MRRNLRLLFWILLALMPMRLMGQSEEPDATSLIAQPMATKIYSLAHKYPSAVARMATYRTISAMEADRLLYQLDRAAAADFLVALSEERNPQDVEHILESEGYFTKPEMRYAQQVIQLRPRQRRVKQLQARQRVVRLPQFAFDLDALYEALAVGNSEIALRVGIEVTTRGTFTLTTALDTLPPRLAEMAVGMIRGEYQQHPPQPAQATEDGKTQEFDTSVYLTLEVLHPLLSPNENSGVCVAYVERDKAYDPWTMPESETRQLAQRLGLSERRLMMTLNQFLNNERSVAHKTGSYRIRFVAHGNELRVHVGDETQGKLVKDPTYTLLSATRQ